ncbi:MAG: hypothetical protein PHT44_03430 [Candidatus Portnoybacteria bacterium]|nr:hypothetical protein [Candidatus Portnoybacteria bacterium]MDD4982593.1 hypothetical protein [Candidatus Portnoybacteria bacterium]
MTEYQHKELATGRWANLSFFEQMANIGSEVERAIKWRAKNKDYFQMALDRALELLDLTADDSRNSRRLGELLRLREVLADYFCFDNIYGSTDKKWQNYFLAFNYAARVNL